MALSYHLLEGRCVTDVTIKNLLLTYLSCKTTNQFYIAVGLYSSRSQKVSKCHRNISDTLSCVPWATFFVLTIFCVGASHTWQNKYNNNFYASRFLVFLYRIITMNDKWGSIWRRFEVIASYTALNPSLKLTQQKLPKKNCRQCSSNAHGVEKLHPKYLVSGTINCM